MEYLSKPVIQNKLCTFTLGSYGVLKITALHMNMCSKSQFSCNHWECMIRFI